MRKNEKATMFVLRSSELKRIKFNIHKLRSTNPHNLHICMFLIDDLNKFTNACILLIELVSATQFFLFALNSLSNSCFYNYQKLLFATTCVTSIMHFIIFLHKILFHKNFMYYVKEVELIIMWKVWKSMEKSMREMRG